MHNTQSLYDPEINQGCTTRECGGHACIGKHLQCAHQVETV